MGDDQVVYSGKRMDLCIKECPPDIAYAFIEFARNNWHGKQWVALKDLLRMWNEEDRLNRMNEELMALRRKVENHEDFLSHIKLVPSGKKKAKGQENEDEDEEKEDPLPSTFGGKK